MASDLGWIAVPGGRVVRDPGQPGAAGVAVLRVVIVPRLVEPLAGTALEDWPATINAAVPDVEVRRRPDADPQPVAATLRRIARSDAWRALTSHDMEVRPWEPRDGYDPPAVTETMQQAGHLEMTYREAARSLGDDTTVRTQLATWGPAPSPAAPQPSDPVFEKVDFHRAVALLREHPHVLRTLGLILELEVRADELPRSAGADQPQVRVGWPASPIPVSSTWTAYEYDGTHFLPARGGDVRRGVVDLSDESKWQVVTVDVDGAVGRVQEAAQAVLADGPDGPSAHLPTLRSAGLQLVRVGRAEQLAARAARGRTNAANPSLTDRVLDADELVLGYRIDVRPQDTEKWFSLHARRAEYTLDGIPVGDEAVAEEEGHLKPHAVVRAAGRLRADQIVARWSGWSLSLPRPAVDGHQPVGGPTEEMEGLVPYQFGIRYEIVERSLPVLRFGRAYQLRARVVDLAGGGLELDDAIAGTEPTGETPYVRYEPVPPPELVQPDGLLVPDPARPGAFVVDLGPLGPGGTPERLVVRSEPTDEGVFSAAPFAGAPAYPPNGERTLVAPSTTFQLAEQHGVIGGDAAALDRVLRTTATDPRDALPDPIAHGAAVALLPEPGGLDEIDDEARPWGGTWPDLQPKRIELVPGDVDDEISLHWDPSPDGVDPASDPAGTAFVTLPPGCRVLVELSSTVLQGNLDTFAISRLAAAPAADTATIRGRHPMITPASRIELVHAVRRPLSAPTGTLTTHREPGSTGVVLQPHDTVLGLHTPSTAQLELRATWQEWGDAPEPAERTGLLPAVPVAPGTETLPELRQEFGDTKHREVAYTATAISRFRDCFDPGDADDLFRVATSFPPVSVKSSARPAPPAVVSTVPAFAWSDAASADGGLVRTRASGRLRVHLGRPWFTTGEGECVAVVIWPGTEDDVPPHVRPLVSWFNRDPIHPTTAPRALADEASFRGAVGPMELPLVETGDLVRVLPYPVSFHEGSPFADIEVPGTDASSYAPFAHLALARFQRESLDGLSLSTVVRTDMVPVLPDRRLEVTVGGAAAQVSLFGTSRRGSRPNRVTATLEHSDAADAPGAPVELTSLGAHVPAFPAWVRVPGATVAGTTGAALPPLPLPGGSGRFRIVVRETEDLGPRNDGLVEAADELAERTVYLDVVPLPDGD
jgi:hypothetical protein